MGSTTIEILQPMFYFNEKWIYCLKPLTDFDNFNILSFSNIQHTIFFNKEPILNYDLFPTFNSQKNVYECVDPWNSMECSTSHLIDQNEPIDSELNTPNIVFPPADSHHKEQPNLLCEEDFEEFISRELSFFNKYKKGNSFSENTRINASKRKSELPENLESPSKRFKDNKSNSIGNRYPTKKILDSPQQQVPNETLFIFHKHLIKEKQENKKFFNKIKGVTYTLDTYTKNYCIPHTYDCENTTLYSKMTIPNIPCYIQLILITKEENTDIIVNKKFLDIKDNKFFVYDRVFTILFKTREIPLEHILIKFKKGDLKFIDGKFFNLYKSKSIMFPIYSIKEIMFPGAKNQPEKKNKELKVNIDNIYKVRYIPESNNSMEIESLYHCLHHLGVKVDSNNSIRIKENTGKQPATNNDKIFSFFQGIFYEIKMKMTRSLRFRSVITNRLTKKDLATVIKEIFIECSNILNFDGVKLNTNESFSPHDDIVFSLYLFLYQKIVNTGVEYLDTYDELVGRVWILSDIYITQEGGINIGSNCN